MHNSYAYYDPILIREKLADANCPNGNLVCKTEGYQLTLILWRPSDDPCLTTNTLEGTSFSEAVMLFWRKRPDSNLRQLSRWETMSISLTCSSRARSFRSHALCDKCTRISDQQNTNPDISESATPDNRNWPTLTTYHPIEAKAQKRAWQEKRHTQPWQRSPNTCCRLLTRNDWLTFRAGRASLAKASRCCMFSSDNTHY